MTNAERRIAADAVAHIVAKPRSAIAAGRKPATAAGRAGEGAPRAVAIRADHSSFTGRSCHVSPFNRTQAAITPASASPAAAARSIASLRLSC
jgi:hypothetical protein